MTNNSKILIDIIKVKIDGKWYMSEVYSDGTVKRIPIKEWNQYGKI